MDEFVERLRGASDFQTRGLAATAREARDDTRASPRLDSRTAPLLHRGGRPEAEPRDYENDTSSYASTPRNDPAVCRVCIARTRGPCSVTRSFRRYTAIHGIHGRHLSTWRHPPRTRLGDGFSYTQVKALEWAPEGVSPCVADYTHAATSAVNRPSREPPNGCSRVWRPDPRLHPFEHADYTHSL